MVGTFEGTPEWFSGAGTPQDANPFWTAPQFAANRAALIKMAKGFRVEPTVFYNALRHAGQDPNAIDYTELSHKMIAAADAFRSKHHMRPGQWISPSQQGELMDSMADSLGPLGAIFKAADMPEQGTPGQPGHQPPQKGAKFLVDYHEQRHLPGMEETYGPYKQQPGLLKMIADITGGRLKQRAEMSPSDRVYKGKRLADFTQPQKDAQAALSSIAEDAPANSAANHSIFRVLERLQSTDPLSTANGYLRQGTAAVTPEERGLFRESAMRDVVTPLRDKMRRDLLENIIPAIDANRIQRGNLYGGGRDRLREKALQNFEREFAEASLPHLFAAEQQGQQSAERQRQAQINAGQISAPAGIQAMGAQREAAQSASDILRNKQLQSLVAAEAGTSAGAVQQAQEQKKLDIAAQNWEAEQRGLMDEAAEAAAIARGQQIPRFSTSSSPVAATQSLPSVIGQLALGTGFMSMMPQPKTAKAGGRIKLSTGGVAVGGGAPSPYADYRKRLFDQIMGGAFNGNQSMASEAVSQNMMDQAPPVEQQSNPNGFMPDASAAPSPSAGPLERGGQSALTALDKMNEYRQKLAQKSASLDAGAQDVNPMLPFLARTFIGAAGNPSTDLATRLGAGAQEGYKAFEEQRAANARNKELSLNIEKALLETHQKEHEHEMALQNARDIAAAKAEAKANAPTKPKFYYNQQTGTHYTIDDNGQMVVAPGAPAPQTPEMKADEEIKKVRQVEAVKTEEANINKLQEEVNKAQKSIGNYNTIIHLLEETGVSKHIGPMKAKFFQNQKIQGLLLSKKTVSELQTFNSALNKAVLDDIKLTGSNPSERDVVIVQDSKPSSNDTPQAALKKAMINKAAYERNMGFANFTKKMWREKGWPSYKSQEVYNRWMQANPLFSSDGESILKAKDKPEDYEHSKDEEHDIIGTPEEKPDVTITEYSPQSAAADNIGVDRLTKDKDKIMAALAAKRAGNI